MTRLPNPMTRPEVRLPLQYKPLSSCVELLPIMRLYLDKIGEVHLPRNKQDKAPQP